jgi:hypothetical protein
MMRNAMTLPLIAAFLLCSSAALAGNASRPVGEPVLERPTLHSLGAYWIIDGDDNQNATIELAYRKAGSDKWQEGFPLFRVEKGRHQPEGRFRSTLNVPDSGWLFAGSVVMLEPDTAYELRLTLNDPDGGQAQHILASRTIAEPQAPGGGPTYHVVPGTGGGSGTQRDPYRGLAAAQEQAKPGDTFLIHRGVYPGTFNITNSGQEGKPIIWRGAGDGEAIIDGQGNAPKRPGRGVSVTGMSDIWLEDLTIRNADWGVVAHESQRIVVRRCRIHSVEYGMTATTNQTGNIRDFFISDNVMQGPSTWPRTAGIENARGVQITGEGHVICYNRVSGFADGIDTMPSNIVAAIDIHNNEISEQTDDGIETDYSHRNVRVFHNRLTNIFQGISTQPVHGGPVYIFRNVMYNIEVEPFKIHNSPSGVLLFHNTSVKQGGPWLVWTSAPFSNFVSRNNLFIGTQSRIAIDCTAPASNVDFDYDGFGGGPFEIFLRWNQQRYATFEEMRQKAPIYRNAVRVDAGRAFASNVKAPPDHKKQYPVGLDLRLARNSEAVDAGQVLPNFADTFTGRAPDLGAYELGQPLPHYGPRNQRPRR